MKTGRFLGPISIATETTRSFRGHRNIAFPWGAVREVPIRMFSVPCFSPPGERATLVRPFPLVNGCRAKGRVKGDVCCRFVAQRTALDVATSLAPSMGERPLARRTARQPVQRRRNAPGLKHLSHLNLGHGLLPRLRRRGILLGQKGIGNGVAYLFAVARWLTFFFACFRGRCWLGLMLSRPALRFLETGLDLLYARSSVIQRPSL